MEKNRGSGPVPAPAKPPPPLEKPALLKGGMVVCWIYGAVLALLVWLTPALEKMGISDAASTIWIPGFPPMRELSAQVLYAMRVLVIPLLILSIVTAYGLAKDRHWSRWMMMLLLVLGIVLLPPELATPPDYAISVALAAFGWWYLYRKPNVVGYYEAIKASETNR